MKVRDANRWKRKKKQEERGRRERGREGEGWRYDRGEGEGDGLTCCATAIDGMTGGRRRPLSSQTLPKSL